MKKLFLFFILFSLNSFGWSGLTIKYMVVNAYKTFPDGLKMYLNENRRDILKGVDSIREQDFSSSRELEEFICSQKKKIVKMIKGRKRIKDIAFELGRMFKAIAILSYPFAFEDSFYSRDYSNYLSRKTEKFIFSFKRVKNKNLKTTNCEILIKSLYKESRGFKEKILNDYRIYEDSSNFDDLSASFGAGSLLFSDSCFTMSVISADIWKSVNGKLEGCLILERNGR